MIEPLSTAPEPEDWLASVPVPEDAPEEDDENDGEFAVTNLPNIGPVLSDEALYGLPGNIVRKLLPNTEAHPAGLLVDVLLRFGNIIGRTAYYQVEGTRHYPVLFAVRVGATAKARKGTSGDRISQVYEGVSKSWSKSCIRHGGLSTGEGLIEAVRDSYHMADGTIVDGVKDKRLFIYESEFAAPLIAMQREGNLLSRTIRAIWDGKTLETITKVNPRTATGAHISIVGDITLVELKGLLENRELFNGYANRHLWVHVHRTKLLPFGGQDIDWAEEQTALRSAFKFARSKQRIFMDGQNTRKMWERFYVAEQDKERTDNIGTIKARSEAQVIRLALLYALLDKSSHIKTAHLRAALALWKYCDESVCYIFGDFLTKSQKKIVLWLLEQRQLGKQEQKRRDIIRGCLCGSVKNDVLAKDMVALVDAGYIEVLGADGGSYQSTGKKVMQ